MVNNPLGVNFEIANRLEDFYFQIRRLKTVGAGRRTLLEAKAEQ